MPNTTILFLLCFFAALAASIMHPIWALVAYLVDYYQHPPLRWWGRWLPSSMRWALLASIVLLVTNLMHGKMPLANNTVRHKQVKCLLLFCVIAALVTPNAVSVDRSIHYLTILVQLTLLVLVMINTMDRMPYWRLVIVLMAFGSLTWGLDAWIDPDREAGRLQAIGGPDSRDDNSAALHLLGALPFIAVLMFHGRRYERVLGILAFPFVVNTIILCNSRGATVAMVAMGLSAVVLASGTLRLKLATVVVAGAVATAVLADPQFVERQLTIVSGEQDGSTRGRIEAWKGALELMQDYPLGAGGGGFDVLSPVYIPEVVARYDGAERGVHNTYLWIGSDWGALGLLAFLGYLWFTFWSVQRARRHPALDRRTALEGLALQTALVGVCVGAFFINRSYGEILYWIPALGTAYVNLTESQVLNAPDAAGAGKPGVHAPHMPDVRAGATEHAAPQEAYRHSPGPAPGASHTPLMNQRFFR